MKTAVKSVMITLVVILVVAGCIAKPDKVDTVPPEVVSMSPSDGATEIAVNASVTALFSKPVNGVAGTTTSFTIQKVGSFGTLPAAVTYDTATMVATLDPAADLEPDSVYVVTLNGDLNKPEIKSKTGIYLEPVSWTFVTKAESDTIPPSIVSKTPESEARYILTDSKIIVAFTEEIQETSAISANFRLTRNGAAVPATISYNGDKLTLEPKYPLDDWTAYVVTLTDGIRDIAGNRLSETIWTFQTDDQNPPVIVERQPVAGDTAVPVNGLITIRFSESIKSHTIHNTLTNFTLTRVFDGARVDALVTYNDTTRTATLAPASVLEMNTEYAVSVLDAIKDNAHNALASESWNFTTSAVPDTIPPAVSFRNPDVNDTEIAVTSSAVIEFSEKVTGVNAASVQLKKSHTGEAVSCTVSYNQSTRRATLTPVVMLAEGMEYRISLTDAIVDLAGNRLVPVSWSFVSQDITKPLVLSKTPGADGNVAVNTTIQVVLSELLLESSVNATTVRLDAAGTPVSGAVTWHPETRAIVFDPDAALAYTTSYTVTLTNGIRDLSGNTLSMVTWSFSTGSAPDTTAPGALMIDPVNNADDVVRSTSISVQFTEPVTGVSGSNVILKLGNEGGVVVPAQLTYDPSDRIALILPDLQLKYNTQYTVTVKGSAGIVDAAGNAFPSDVSWTFRTDADTTRPVVINKIPEPGTPDIPGNAVRVEALFSEDVTNVTGTTMYLQYAGTGAAIPCSVSYAADYDANIYRAVLVPLADITVQGMYRVILVSGASGIMDAAGNQIDTTGMNWTLNITAVDETAPAVVSRNPAAGAQWRNKKIEVIFSEPVSGVSGSSFYVSGPSGTVSAVVGYSSGLLTAVLTVDGVLEYDKEYTAYLTGAIRDNAGNQLAPLSWTFKTDPDSIPPVVESVTPANGTNNVPVNSLMTATFSESIQGYAPLTVYLDPPTATDLLWDPGTRTLTIDPTAVLAGDTVYTVHITTGITDLAVTPNPMSAEYTWQFTTAHVEDIVAPTVSSVQAVYRINPDDPDDALVVQGGSIRDTSLFRAIFSEPVVNATSKIVLKRTATQETVSANISYSPTTRTALLSPDEPLLASTGYTLLIRGGATGVKDAAGNFLAADSSTAFVTEADSVNPYIIPSSQYPVSGATGVPLRPAISVTFNEPVTGVTASSFTLATTSVATYVFYDEVTRTATLTLGDNLSNNTLYTVTIGAGSTIRDRANRAMATHTFTFTTTAAPVIDTCVPGEGSTDISVDIPSIDITFNRAMNPAKGWIELTESGSLFPQAIPGIIAWSNGNKTASIALKGPLKANTAYRAKLYGWGGSFEDADGNLVSKTAVVNDGVLNFTTGADTTAPVLESSTPHDGQPAVGRNLPHIMLRFSEPMDVDPAQGAFSFTTGSSPTLGARSWIEGNRTLIIPITSQLAAGSYVITESSGNRFRDASGTRRATSFVIGFTVGATTGSTLVTNSAEGFENPVSGSYFDSYRNIIESVAGIDWSRMSAGVFPSVTPVQGSYLARASSWEWDPDVYADLESAAMDCTTSGSYILSFRMAHEALYNRGDRIEVYASTNGGVSYSQVYSLSSPLRIYRYDHAMVVSRSGTITAGSAVVTGLSTTGDLRVGMTVTGSGVPESATIASVDSASQITLNLNANTSASTMLTFPGLPQWRTHYVDLSYLPSSSSVRVKLRAYSAGETGGNIYVDDIKVIRY